MRVAVISAAVSLTVAGLGFWFTYYNTRRLNQRQDRLTRVNQQLSQLYGPMLTLTATSDAAWRAYVNKYGQGIVGLVRNTPQSVTDQDEWMSWVRVVLMPLNRRLFEKIVQGGDLLIGSDMPRVLLAFSAHVVSWEATIARWDRGQRDELNAAIDHPGRDLYRYAETCYNELKELQGVLLEAKIRGAVNRGLSISNDTHLPGS